MTLCVWINNIDWLRTLQLFIPPIATSIAAVALIFNGLALWTNTKARHLQTFYDVFKNVQDLQDKFYKDYANKQLQDKKNWLSIFFNAQECMAFLINKGHLKGDYKDFYKQSFITMYEEIFMKNAAPEEIKDATQYPEIKKLYNVFIEGTRSND